MPEGNGDISVGDVTVRLDGTITSKRALIAGERAGSHKRDGSDPSVGERQVPVSKRRWSLPLGFVTSTDMLRCDPRKTGSAHPANC